MAVAYTLGLGILLCGGYVFYVLLNFGSRDKRLPPGPPTIPILGNAHMIPGKNLAKKLKEWGDQYGSIYSLKIGAGTLIILNDKRSVHDLRDKRSAIYSDRPIDEQMTTALKENFAFMDANTTWRARRKLASHFLAPKNIDNTIMGIQEAETSQLVYDLLKTPEDFFDHIKRVTASVGSIVVFGFRAPSVDSWWANSVYEAIDQINLATTPGSYLPVAQFPILRYIPDFLAPSKARAITCFNTVSSIWTHARSQVEARRQRGDYRISLADKLLSGELKSDKEMNQQEEANFLGTLQQGAADTTASVLLTSVLFLTKNPWVQKKAQSELDLVCGDGRMPTWQDFEKLPYINCIVKESLRIRPVLPSGVPVRANRDDYFDGFLIPKDASIFTPAYCIQHNAELYPDPYTYNPDRFLDRPLLAMSYAGSPDYENRDHFSYGAGRRICAGIHLAERTQWRIIARLLWAFDIKPALGEDGQEIQLDTDAYDDGLLIAPKKFKVKFVPRNEKRQEVIHRDFEAVEDFLKKWE